MRSFVFPYKGWYNEEQMDKETFMKEKKNLTIVDKKQIPTEEPARQYYFMEIAKQ